MFSAASIATMTACIFLFGLFFSLLINFRYIVKNAEEGVAVTVLFDDGVDQATINRGRLRLRGLLFFRYF